MTFYEVLPVYFPQIIIGRKVGTIGGGRCWECRAQPHPGALKKAHDWPYLHGKILGKSLTLESVHLAIHQL